MIDLFSRRAIGWSMQGRTYTDLPLQALLTADLNCKAFSKLGAVQGLEDYLETKTLHGLGLTGLVRTLLARSVYCC